MENDHTMKKTALTAITMITGMALFAQDANNIQMPGLLSHNQREMIRIPDIGEYTTLKCDFHMHTVFSDGVVWPTVRVQEAWQEGLDAIAITDHIERNPSKRFIEGDDNSSYEIAKWEAKKKNILLIHAGEITRRMPPGHFNALFLSDVNALDTPDYMDAFQAASDQGAYIIWNHPGWKAQQPDSTQWWDIHTELYEKGWLHAIEVFNEKEWYPLVLDWCIDKNLAVIGTSDIHGIISNTYNLEEYHRPMTLVFARERTLESLKEAMMDNRTAAWFGNQLAGKEEYLKAIFEASITQQLYDESSRGNLYIFTNDSDIPFHLRSEGHSFVIPASGETQVTLPVKTDMKYQVTNLHIGTDTNLEVELGN